MFTRAIVPSIVLSAFLLPACGGGGGAADQAKADAAKKAADEKKAAEDEGIAKRRAEREAKEKAKEEAEAKKKELIEQLAVQPEEKPDPKKICETLVNAQTEFDKKHFPPETAAKLAEAAGTRLKMLEQQCASSSPEMAACQINVLNKLPAGQELHSALPEFFQACAMKFSGGGKAPAVPGKPR